MSRSDRESTRPPSGLPRARHWALLAMMAGATLPCLALAADAASAGVADPAAAAAPAAWHDREIAIAASLGYENVKLPAGERLGLLGASLLFDGSGGWWFGPGVYGATSGERGGFFVGGIEAQRRWRMGPGQLVAGLYAGGGGGAAAPIGSGLMVRPALAWLQDFGPIQAGLSWSEVRFPSGSISSRQLGMLVSWDGRFRHADLARVGEPVRDAERSGIGVDCLVGTLSRYSLRNADGSARRIGLVGARLMHDGRGAPWGGEWHWGVETGAAASGDAAGYMEILGTAGWYAPLGAGGALRAGLRGALGLGGGGAVPTGGGPIVKLVLGVSFEVSPTLLTGVEVGRLHGLDSSLNAPIAQWWLSMALEPPPRGDGLRVGTLARTEWTAAWQHYSRAARRSGDQKALDTMGLKLARYFGDHLYGTAQAHSAFAGGAGAYSVGLVGAGLATSSRGPAWRAGAEVLGGAAGGGGVATGGAGIAQVLLWAAWSPAPATEVRAGAGAVRSRGSSGLSSPIAELSFTRAFGQSVP